ncbi:ROK family protein [Fodinisporobacter ferrooxydans]|uniref:ROK family protein n=1 Tax=Fodinisporobacter ferrooxydans TaxID=2901836 RepID=A0ABY4CH19_9BACL|nr:ROK family protein [Alicyclobacillaceae bacterium MYW30-H2]
MYQLAPLSRKELSKITKLTPAAITNITSELIDEGYLCETGMTSNGKTPGRREMLLDIDPNKKKIISFHIGRKKMSCGLSNAKGIISKKTEFQIESLTMQETIGLMISYVNHVKSDRSIVGIGIGINGFVDFQTGRIKRRVNQSWDGAYIGKIIEQKTSIPTIIDNNVRTMVLAEKFFGYAKNLKNVLFLYVDQGVGAGLVIEGTPYSIGDMEIGHISINLHGEKCWCGNQGCVELYTNEDYILSESQRLVPEVFQDGSVTINKLAKYKSIPELEPLFKSVGTALGVAIINVLKILSIEQVIGCGNILENKLVWELLQETIRERYTFANEEPKISKSFFEDDIGVKGAASLGIYHFIIKQENNSIEPGRLRNESHLLGY